MKHQKHINGPFAFQVVFVCRWAEMYLAWGNLGARPSRGHLFPRRPTFSRTALSSTCVEQHYCGGISSSRVTCAGRYSLLLIQFVPDLPKASVVLPPLVSLSGVWTNSTQEGLNALLDFTHSSCLGNFREFFHDNNIGRYFLGRFEALRGGTEFRTTHVGANKNPCTSFVELCGIFP